MALTISDKFCAATIVLLILLTGLLYNGYAFRIRESITGSAEACISDTAQCSSPSSTISTSFGSSKKKLKPEFEKVSLRGGFSKIKEQSYSEDAKGKKVILTEEKEKINTGSTFKITKNTISAETEDSDDDDDEIVLIEVEADETEDDCEDTSEYSQHVDRKEIERQLMEEAEQRLKEEQERKQKELNEKQKKEEEKLLKKQLEKEKKDKEKEEQRLKEEQERKRKELNEKRKKEEEKLVRKQLEKQKKDEEEAEQRLKEEQERKQKEFDEKQKKEEEKIMKKQLEKEKKAQEEKHLRDEEYKKALKGEQEKIKEKEKRLEEKRRNEEAERRREEEIKRESEEKHLKEVEIKEKEKAIRLEEERKMREVAKDQELKDEKIKREKQEELLEEEKKRNEELLGLQDKQDTEKESIKNEEPETMTLQYENGPDETVLNTDVNEIESEEKLTTKVNDLEKKKDQERVAKLKKITEENKIRDEIARRKDSHDEEYADNYDESTFYEIRDQETQTVDEKDDSYENDVSEEDSNSELNFTEVKYNESLKTQENEENHEQVSDKEYEAEESDTGLEKHIENEYKETESKNDPVENQINVMNVDTFIEDSSKDAKSSAPQMDPKTVPLSLVELNNMILSVPTFVPNFTAVEDSVCQLHGMMFLKHLQEYKLWALQMLDSSAKIPAGLLRGNVNQLGDFDQCLGIQESIKSGENFIKIQGKYCLASVDLQSSQDITKFPVYLMQSRALIKGTLEDPGHFVPKFTTANWAVCLPAACSPDDAQKAIESALQYYNETNYVKFDVKMQTDSCYVKEYQKTYSLGTIGVLYLFAIVPCVAIIATLRDYIHKPEEKSSYSERVIMAFSFKRTLHALFGHSESNSEIECIHGIRTLATIVLYVAHKLIPLSRIPYANRGYLTEDDIFVSQIASSPLSVLLRASLFYTDSFLLLSGVLSSYSMAIALKKRGEINYQSRFFARYMRLTPSLLAVVFWYAFVMEHTGSGPQWNASVKANADICKWNAWFNLLYIQNAFPFEKMCAPHTHQLALDMQLFLVAPVIVSLLVLKPLIGTVIVLFLLQISATFRYFATANNNLSLVIFHGMTLKDLYKTANLTYTMPHHRATPYLFGISLGVILSYTGKRINVPKIFIIIGWLMATAIGSWSLFSPWHLAKMDYVYEVEEATFYAVVSPFATAIFLCWIIFACFTNNGGVLNYVLSSYTMLVFSRLSYAIYLTQFIVFLYTVGTVRYSSEFQPLRVLDPFELVSVLAGSVVLTLLFDIPMQEVKNVIIECNETKICEPERKSTEIINHEDHHNDDLQYCQKRFRDEDDRRLSRKRGSYTEPQYQDYEDVGIQQQCQNLMYRSQNPKRQSFVRSQAYDEWDDHRSRRSSKTDGYSFEEGERFRNEFRRGSPIQDDQRDYSHYRKRYGSYSRSPLRDVDMYMYKRSISQERSVMMDSDVPMREYSHRRPLITISKEDDFRNVHPARLSSRRVDNQRSISTDSDFDSYSSYRSSANFNGRRSAEPRMSNEDNWEEELRAHRGRFSSQERERVPPPTTDIDEWNLLRRRSSAEGKMALLQEPMRPGNMELWTVSKIALGSSQEPDDEDADEEMYLQQQKEYRNHESHIRDRFEEDSEAGRSLPVSFDAEDDVNTYDFSLSRHSKRITVQDLSRLSHDDDNYRNQNWNTLDVHPGVIKRESMIKSQASEEDPEYLIPERPKLVEQEQEHPFKKAWQLQKSRSEEENKVLLVKDTKGLSLSPEKSRNQSMNNEEKNHAQSEDVDEICNMDCGIRIIREPQCSSENEENSKSFSEEPSESSDWSDEENDLDILRDRRKNSSDRWAMSERKS